MTGLSLRGGSAAPDVIVYDASPSGIQASIAAQRLGAKSLLVSPNGRIGGMVTGGLARTDYKGYNPATWPGRQTKEFYARVGACYNKTIGQLAYSGTAQLAHEPKIGERCFREMLADYRVDVLYGYRVRSVKKIGSVIGPVIMEQSTNPTVTKVLSAETWIEASYTGDLIMRVPGLSWTYGREANATYGEAHNGTQLASSAGVSPFNIAGDPSSGLLPFFTDAPLAAFGTADNKLQAYGYRLTVTTDVANQSPFPDPVVYNPMWYEGLGRKMVATPANYTNLSSMFLVVAIPSAPTKFDLNNKGAFSLDVIGGNVGFLTLDYDARQAIIDMHTNYTLGLLKFLRTDPRVPAALSIDLARYGFCADEYTGDNNTGMSPELYVREGARLVNDNVLTEATAKKNVITSDPVAYSGYPMDVHGCQYLNVGGTAYFEGSPSGAEVDAIYGLPYGVMLPKHSECTNLLVAGNGIAVSHTLFASARMEIVLQSLGEAAGVAAGLRHTTGTPLHDITSAVLRPYVRTDDIVPANVLSLSGAAGIATPSNGTVEVNNPADWTFGLTTVPDYWGVAYAEASSAGYGTKWAKFTPFFGEAGDHVIRLNATLDTNSKAWFKVEIKDATGLRPPMYVQFKYGETWFLNLGTYFFNADGTEYILCTNSHKPGVADGGRMQIDAVAWKRMAA